MILQDITELNVVGVYDRGVPGQERIVIRVGQTVNLGQYGVMLGIRGTDGAAFPVRDNLFWFGDGLVFEGDWLFIYTGPGQARATTVPNTSETLYSIHWGRPTTILNAKELVPILFRVDAVQVMNDHLNLPGTA
jgi:hypothetical protein